MYILRDSPNPPSTRSNALSFTQATVFSNITTHLPQLLRSPRGVTVLGFGIAAAASITGYLLTRKRLTEAEREQQRREHLALTGRITDGSITETHWLADPTSQQSDTPPHAHTDTQPSSSTATRSPASPTGPPRRRLPRSPTSSARVHVDLPIRVRFDPATPATSIVVAEAWNDLRGQHSSGQHTIAQPQTDPITANAPPQSKSLSHHG